MLNSFDSRRLQQRARRYSFTPEILCQVIDPATDQPWAAWVRDISATGISFTLETQFGLGHCLLLEFYGKKQPFCRKLPIQVRHCEILFPNDTWLHGCAFDQKMSDTDLEYLIANA